MEPPPGCCREEELTAFLLGDLPEGQARAVALHLEDCPACAAEASRLDGLTDPLLRSLRRAVHPAEPGASPCPASVENVDDFGPKVQAAPKSPRTVAGFELLGELGRGGMGVVYKARQTRPARLVALKMILAGGHAGPERRARFLAEADAIARLQHPNIVGVFEVGFANDVPFFSLELVEGGNLADKLAGTPQPARWAAGLVETLARAAHCAHQRGVIHRDLKPGNVLLTADGAPKIADFGLARLEQERLGDSNDDKRPKVGPAAVRPPTASDAILGTPSYMAPEQAQGKSNDDKRPKVGPAADVYALGAVLYECLTGRPPFRSESPLDTLVQVISDEPVPPTRLNPKVPRDVETVCLKCLQKSPERRYPSAAELADDLGRWLRGEPIRARPVGVLERGWRWGRRNPGWAAILLLALLCSGSAWMVQLKWARLDRADQETHGVLQGGLGLLDEGWQAHDLVKLTEAKAEADHAVDVARTGAARTAVQEEARTFLAEARERLRRAKKNQALLDAVLDVSITQETRVYADDGSGGVTALAKKSVNEQYADAFRAWGLDVDQTEESKVAERLRQEPEVVVLQVVAALDGWMQERRRRERPEAEWRRLYRLAEKLDGGDRRRLLRSVLVEGLRPESVVGLLGAWPPWPAFGAMARGSIWQRLQQVRRQVDPATEPVLTVVLLAQASSRAGDAAGAEQVLRLALARRPNEVVLLDALGRLLEGQGPARLGEAIGCFRAIRARRPRLGVALGVALGAARQWPESEAVFRDLLRQQPSNPEMYLSLGNALFAQKKLDEAVAAYRNAIRLKQDYASAYYNLGNALQQQKKPDEAEAAYRMAVRRKADFAEAHVNLGIALQQQKKLDDAVAAYRMAIKFKPDLAKAYSNLGNALQQQNKLDEAVAAYRQAVRLMPDYPKAYYNLGKTLREQKKLDEAVTAYRMAVRLKPNYAQAHTNLGNALHDQKKLDEAVVAYRMAVSHTPDDPKAHYNLGIALREQKKLDEAVAAYRMAVTLKPDYAEAQVNLGNALREQNKLNEAVAVLRQAVKCNPDLAQAHTNLGNALREQKKLDEAAAACRQGVRLKPDDPKAHYNLGLVLREQKKLDKAVAAYRMAIRLKPDYAEAIVGLGIALGEQKKLDEAVTAFRQALRLKPDYAEAHFNLGGVLGEQKKLDEAVTAFRQALKIKPEFAVAHNNLGLALRAQKKLDEAVAAFRQAVKLKPDLAEAHNNLGLALYDQKKLDEAVTACCQAVKLKPDLAEAHHNLGLALRAQKKLHQAVAVFRQAIKLKPDFAEAHNDLGLALRAQNKLDAAAAAFRQAVKFKPDYPKAHYHLGIALADQGKLPEAAASYTEVVRLKPDFPEAHCNLGSVQRRQGKFAESLASYRRGHELGVQTPGWSYNSARWVGQARRLVELDNQLPALLQGDAAPKNTTEQIEFARLCSLKMLHAAATRFYAAAFTANGGLADDLATGLRYNAACSAALAVAGKGKDAPRPDKEQAHLRKQALGWLRADLAGWAKVLDIGAPETRPGVQRILTHWLADADLAGVRAPAALARLSEDERHAWQKLWADVAALRKRTEGK